MRSLSGEGKRQGLACEKVHPSPGKLITIRCSGEMVGLAGTLINSISIIFMSFFLLKVKQNIVHIVIEEKLDCLGS